MSEHTPLPWYLCDDLTIRARHFTSAQMADYQGAIVCDLKPALGAESTADIPAAVAARAHALPETKANAAYILNAVNAHDALLAACEAMLRCTVIFALTGDPDLLKASEEANAQARAAIAKAKGVQP